MEFAFAVEDKIYLARFQIDPNQFDAQSVAQSVTFAGSLAT